VYNELNENLPKYDDLTRKLCRSAFIGFSASAISDTVSNSIRVIKVGGGGGGGGIVTGGESASTGLLVIYFAHVLQSSSLVLTTLFPSFLVASPQVYRQTNKEKVSYPEAVRRVIAEDGLVGLFGRGLSTKILANGFQGLLFTVLWKSIDEAFFAGNKKK